MEVEALQHILAWLGFPEKHLPRPGEFADFDDLVTLLDGVGAKARLVTDPVPFLETTRPPLDRWVAMPGSWPLVQVADGWLAARGANKLFIRGIFANIP